MKFILLSDIHGTDKIPVARKDNVMKAFEKKFSFVIDYANKNNCTILQAGDLSDSSRNWSTLCFLLKKLKSLDQKFLTVFGQHDMYMRSKPTSQTPTTMLALINAGLVKTLGAEPICFADVGRPQLDSVYVYGSSWQEGIPKIKTGPQKNVLVLHSSISITEEYPGHAFTTPNKFMETHPEFDLILVGDIHKEFVFETYNNRRLINTGPLLRLQATTYNMTHKPCFYVWDSKINSIKKILVPHAKAKEVLSRDHLKDKKITRPELELFVASIENLIPIKVLREKKIEEFLASNIKSGVVRRVVKKIMKNGQEI
jgi:DNA repair exonuclease SbcCD nuclease subunit